MVSLFAALMFSAAPAPAQATEFTPPPMVPAGSTATPPPPAADPAGPPPMPPPEPTVRPGTPPPPALTPSSPSTVSPYGNPKAADEKPPVEYGLMVSESLFGMLTAAGVSLLPYFLLLRDFVEGRGGGIFGDNATVGTIIYVILFAAIPLSVAQTEVSIANGSRWYYSETWPAALIGLGTEGAVLGLAYLTRGSSLSVQGPIANPYVLLIGTIGVVPLVQMAMINLFKSPRFGKAGGGGGGGALLNYKEGHGMTVGIPSLSPVFNAGRVGELSGAQFSLLSGRF